MRELLPITLPIFALGAAAFWWASRHATPAVRRARWLKFALYVVIVHGVLLATVAGTPATLALFSLLAMVGWLELSRAARPLARGERAWTMCVFGALAMGTLWLITDVAPRFIAYLYMVVAVFDGFSQASGQLAGRTKLAPAISPGKTIEGWLIGAASALGGAIVMRHLAGLSASQAAAVGIIASSAGLAGDLGASWVKRRAGLKDYGTLLPGHGGVLDRFDSFFAVAAAMSIVSLWW